MDSYKLKETEVVLYKGEIILSDYQANAKLYLTNENLVLVNEQSDTVEVYPIDSIKMYKGIPQINSKGHNVEIYLKDKEIEFSFVKKGDLSKFKTVAFELLTGKTKAERRAEKVKGSIELINNTLNVDIVKSTGNLITTSAVAFSSRLGDSAGRAIESVGDSISSSVRLVGSATSESISGVGDKVQEKVDKVGDTVNQKVKGFGNIGNAFKKIIGKKKQAKTVEDKNVKETILVTDSIEIE